MEWNRGAGTAEARNSPPHFLHFRAHHTAKPAGNSQVIGAILEIALVEFVSVHILNGTETNFTQTCRERRRIEKCAKRLPRRPPPLATSSHPAPAVPASSATFAAGRNRTPHLRLAASQRSSRMWTSPFLRLDTSSRPARKKKWPSSNRNPRGAILPRASGARNPPARTSPMEESRSAPPPGAAVSILAS